MPRCRPRRPRRRCGRLPGRSLERQLDDVTRDLADCIEQSPVRWAKDDLLQSMSGVGRIMSYTLLGRAPRCRHAQPQADRGARGGGTAGARQRDAARGERLVWGGPGERADGALPRRVMWPPLESSACGPSTCGCERLRPPANPRGWHSSARSETPDHPQIAMVRQNTLWALRVPSAQYSC